jgi:hypothetical protein
MRVRELLWLVSIGSGAFPALASAQRTGDQARLIFTVSLGAVGGKNLWGVGAQPVQVGLTPDTLAVGRRIRSTLNVGFSGTYFPGELLGLAIEGYLIGLGYEDSCRQVFASGSTEVAAACTSIQGDNKAATSVVLSAGPVIRFNSRKLFSPYGRMNLGLLFSNQSSLRTAGQFPSPNGPVELPVYSDNHESRVGPALALAGGFTAAVARGYQLRWEVRDNIVGVQRVSAATPQAGVIPPHELEYKHLVSLIIGFDVVLERRRGKRY